MRFIIKVCFFNSLKNLGFLHFINSINVKLICSINSINFFINKINKNYFIEIL